jgi:Zn-dependent metalloprotease
MLKNVLCASLILTSVLNTAASDFEKGLNFLQSEAEISSSFLGNGFAANEMNLANWLFPDSTHRDQFGNTIVHYDIKVQDKPVYGWNKMVVFPKNKSIPDSLLPNVRAMSLASLQMLMDAELEEGSVRVEEELARRIAVRDLRKSGLATGSNQNVNNVPESLGEIWYEQDNTLVQAWHFYLIGSQSGLKVPVEYVVHAGNGNILQRTIHLKRLKGTGIALDGNEYELDIIKDRKSGQFALYNEKLKLKICDQSSMDVSLDEDGNWDSFGEVRIDDQRAEVSLYINFVKTINWYKDNYDILWRNGKSDIKAVAHGQIDLNNAAYSSWHGAFFFGDGSGDDSGWDFMTKALDIVAHEYTHGIQGQLNNIGYSYETGAISEHVADAMAACIDNDDWLIGEDLIVGNRKAQRNMQDPTWGQGHLLKKGMTFKEWYAMAKEMNHVVHVFPKHVDDMIVCEYEDDNGGVHVHNSILNHFFYLASTGDGLTLQGLGRDTMGDLYIQLMKDKYLSRGVDFKEFKDKLMSCAALFFEGQNDYQNKLDTLRQAFQKVGL